MSRHGAGTHHYGPGPDHVADLRVPEGLARGCVVLLHGGFWRRQYGRDLMDPLAVALSERGVASWNVEYRRLGGGGGVPRTLDDVAVAIDHLAGLAPERDGGLGPLLVLGHSAGGHLALCAAGRHRHRGSPRAALAAAISLGGVCDLEEAARLELSGGAAVEFAGGPPGRWPLLYAEVSPPRLLPLGVPHLLVHGRDDDTVPWRLSAQFHERALAAGDEGELLLLDRVGHFEPIDPRTPAGSRVLDWVEAFLARQLGGAASER